MPQFNLERLRETVNQALADHKAEWEQKIEEDRRKYEDSIREWRTTWAARWVKAASDIINKIHDEGVVEKSDLPMHSRGWNDVAYWAPPTKYAQEPYKPPNDLLAFKAVLDMIKGDTISSSALKDHGFVNLSKFTRYLADSVRKDS